MRWFSGVILSLVIFCSVYPNAIASTSAEKAEELFLEGRYDKVITEADKAIASDSGKKYEMYYIKGLSKLKLGKFADARREFEYILDKYPRSARALDSYIGIGDAYFLEGNTHGALRSYKAAADAFPNDKNIGVVRQRISDSMTKSGAQAVSREHESIQPVITRPRESVNFVPKQKYLRIEPAASKSSVGNSAGYFSVQVGSFKNRSNASKLASKLSAKHYDARVESPVSSQDKLYRVKVGKISSKEEADNLAVKLKREGYPTRICRE